MAGKSKDLPGHKWFVLEIKELPEGNFFVYKCRKCDFQTLNGQPMPSPYDRTCEKKKS